MGTSNALSASETKALAAQEAIIETGFNTFVEVGDALLEIRDQRLYRESYDSFENYCRDRWRMSKTHANRLIQSAEVVAEVTPIGATASPGKSEKNLQPPSNEAQARELAKAPTPAARRAAWKKANQQAASEGKPVTAKVVEKAVAEVAAPAEEEEKPKDHRGRVIELEKVKAAFACDGMFAECRRLHRELRNALMKLSNVPAGVYIDTDEITSRMRDVWHLIKLEPYVICPSCGGRGCRDCRQSGFITKFQFETTTPKELCK